MRELCTWIPALSGAFLGKTFDSIIPNPKLLTLKPGLQIGIYNMGRPQSGLLLRNLTQVTVSGKPYSSNYYIYIYHIRTFLYGSPAILKLKSQTIPGYYFLAVRKDVGELRCDPELNCGPSTVVLG